MEASVAIKVKVYSSLAINCHDIEEVGNMSVKLQYLEVRTNYILLKESFHDAIVTVNGLEIILILNGLNVHGSRKFNVTVCNIYGDSSFDVIWKPFGYLKQMYRKRIKAATNIPSPELFGDESSHYADIIEDDNLLTPTQGTNTQMLSTTNTIHVVVENRGISHVFDEHLSSISDNDINASDILYDGYEKPYSTLIENDIEEIKHVYLSTTNNSTYENLTPSENTACGHSPGFTELDSSPDKPKAHIAENDCQEHVKLNYVENCSNERNFQRPYVYKQQNQVEYINLSLKQ
ncbi:uncharacterized protein LOC127717860 isoform X2 [Mytilus californianus]|uniref:uncharacterized protein LOC127717860 isoform X2 n=1 Tax=Mytilus californianus TaxID=6549 RepID=UPI0022476E1F|nr:uncharacterized protein LOC127717860 isoform X2 [Mytilus californianus]